MRTWQPMAPHLLLRTNYVWPTFVDGNSAVATRLVTPYFSIYLYTGPAKNVPHYDLLLITNRRFKMLYDY